MTVKDQLKILDRKSKQNKTDYELYRQNAEISALSSGDLNKYEYLTKKDLGYRPDPLQKATFECSTLGQVFNKGLDSSEKSGGLLKILKNIEDKTDNQIKAIEYQGDRQLDLIDEINTSRKRSVAFNNKVLLQLEKKIKDKGKEIRNNKRSKKIEDKNKAIFNYTVIDGKEFDFTDNIKLLNFAEDLYKEILTFDEAREEQKEMLKKINDLKRGIYPRTGPKPKNSNKEKWKIF